MTPPRTGAARAETRRSAPSSSPAARPRRKGSGASSSGAIGSGRKRAAPRPSAKGARHRQHRPGLRKASAPRARRLPFLIAVFVIVGLLVVGVASLQAVVSQGSFRMQELARHNLELRQDYGRLKLQVAELSSPGRIAAEARRLGFHLPQPGDVRSLLVKGSVPANAGAGTVGRPALSLKSVLEQRP